MHVESQLKKCFLASQILVTILFLKVLNLLSQSCFSFCLLFYSHILFSHAYYASEVNLLFSNYAQIVFGSQSISLPVVLKHDRNRNNIL